jgi:hypothetical protein
VIPDASKKRRDLSFIAKQLKKKEGILLPQIVVKHSPEYLSLGTPH